MAAHATTQRRRSKTSSSGNAPGNNYHHLRDQAAVVKDDMVELAHAAGQMARGQVDPLEDYIRDRPLKSMLIAAGVGALMSFVLLRR